jgi:Mn-dependent DtxR family transcriptional regulator
MNTQSDSNILRIVKEDILEFLGEKKKKTFLSSIKTEVKISRAVKFQALEELKKEKLIKIKGSLAHLTKEGDKKAKDIITKHSIIENYFKERRSKEEAFVAASFLEHYISQEVVDNLKRINALREEGISLRAFKEKQGLITDITSGNKNFERVIGMGICPGSEIKILDKLPDETIIEIENKKFALGQEISREIKLVML